MLDITFEDWINLMIYIKDKNNLAITQLFAADCDVDKIHLVNEMTDEEIEEKCRKWDVIFAISEGQWIEEIDGVVLKNPLELTTQEWVLLLDYIDKFDHTEQALPYIIQFLMGREEYTFDDVVKSKSWFEMAKVCNFFLQKLAEFTLYTEMYSRLETPMLKELMKRIAVNSQIDLN